jgi:hypothetical protein
MWVDKGCPGMRVALQAANDARAHPKQAEQDSGAPSRFSKRAKVNQAFRLSRGAQTDGPDARRRCCSSGDGGGRTRASRCGAARHGVAQPLGLLEREQAEKLIKVYKSHRSADVFDYQFCHEE